jgi:hypothetical protein
MRASTRHSIAVLGLIAVAFPAFATDDFVIKEARARVEHQDVLVSAAMDLDLSEAAEDALTSGIPLNILIEFRLKRLRPLLWNETLGKWTLRAEVRYHALSGLYVVMLQRRGEPRLFPTQRAALQYVGTLDRISLPLPADAAMTGDELRLGLRVRMDREALPVPLRPLAYLSPNWWLNSSWTQWTVAPSSAT